ncbi:MAG: hypothetical protein HC871_01370 [Rhizobiales bacterium]|nr:hypothetical protein [Hyphomicrobiales bacterium]
MFTNRTPEDWDRRVETVRADLARQQAELDAFKQEHGLFSVDDQITIQLGEQSQVRANLQQKQVDMREMESQLGLLKTNLQMLAGRTRASASSTMRS